MKMKAMAHLFENQSPEPTIPLREELSNINTSIANIISGLSDEIAFIRNKLEEIDIKASG